MTHANAPLTPTGRLRLARCVVEDRWPERRAAERFGVGVSTVRRWAARYRTEGAAGMVDRSSRPHHSPRRTPTRRERRIIKVRVTRHWGPARIGFLLAVAPSTVHRVLTRFGLPRLAALDPATGTRVRTSRPRPRSYERDRPGELVHVDVKKLGNIPDGGGHRVLGRAAGRRNTSRHSNHGQGVRGPGYGFLHNAVDDHSRLAYTEIHPDERRETAAGFWTRAHAWFATAGVVVQRVMTDNGACYRSHLFRDALAATGVVHKRTRPYRPQLNGKVERFNRTLLEEWAYARPYPSETTRRDAFPDWLHTYNHHRGHTALGGHPPATRVPNLPGQNN